MVKHKYFQRSDIKRVFAVYNRCYMHLKLKKGMDEEKKLFVCPRFFALLFKQLLLKAIIFGNFFIKWTRRLATFFLSYTQSLCCQMRTSKSAPNRTRNDGARKGSERQKNKPNGNIKSFRLFFAFPPVLMPRVAIIWNARRNFWILFRFYSWYGGFLLLLVGLHFSYLITHQ